MADFRRAGRVGRLPQSFFAGLDAQIAHARASGVDVIDLSKGNPDLPTPPAIVEAMQREVARPENHAYPSFRPRPSVLAAIAERYRIDHGVELDTTTQIAVFHGSHEALMAGILAFADPGETVVLPDPAYPMYHSAALFAGAREVSLPLGETDGQPEWEAIDGLESARVLVLNYPNNPTGAVATGATFERAVSVARRLDALFVHDFAYASLGFDDGAPLSALASDPGAERTVELATLSKTYNMAGWRFGFAVGNASAIAAMRTYQSHAFSTIFGATQEAAAVALAGDQSAAEEIVGTYRARRDAAVAGLRDAGYAVHRPGGSFFVWIDLPDGTDDAAFAARLLAEHGVAVAPGAGFGPRGAGRIRLSLVHPIDILEKAVARMGAALT